MRDAIAKAIIDIEGHHKVRVLYAAESGSRAWGFASPDSDFDVRFIYVHRYDWYLGISEPRDVIEAMLPGDLDLSGWDLRKALRLFLRGNCALNEWLDSPIVYAERGDLAGRIRVLLPTAFKAPAGYHHYLRMAQGVYAEHLACDRVRLKKLFYVLRPLLACRWIQHVGTQPPTAFANLLAASWVGSQERAMIADLEKAKAMAGEGERIELSAIVRTWVDCELPRAVDAAAAVRSTASLRPETLDGLMVETVARAWD